MILELDDGSSHAISTQGTVWQHLLPQFKHLQHVDIDFQPYENYLAYSLDYDTLADEICALGESVDISVDRTGLDKQWYLNGLHEIYERHYDGKHAWLLFHEHIHLIEKCIWHGQTDMQKVKISWRDLGGPLIKPFDTSLLAESTTRIRRGDVYAHWQELGKIPYTYWQDSESDQIKRVLELCQPWRNLHNDFTIGFENVDRMADLDADDFNGWWDKYHDRFCEHNNLEHWTLEDQYSVLVFGRVEDVDTLENKLKQGINPKKISVKG